MRANKLDHGSIRSIDGFFQDPAEVRREALGLPYFRPDSRFPWLISERPVSVLEDIARRVSLVVGKPLKDYSVKSRTTTIGRFAVSLDGASPLIAVHADPFDWACVIYLHPHPGTGTGTRFFRDPSGRLRRRVRPLDPQNMQPWVAPVDAHYRQYFEVENVFNRMVLYPGALFHAAAGFFGQTRRSGRLTLNLFFNEL